MKQQRLYRLLVAGGALLVLLHSFGTAFAHPGKLDGKGGHFKSSDGTYHYHKEGDRKTEYSTKEQVQGVIDKVSAQQQQGETNQQKPQQQSLPSAGTSLNEKDLAALRRARILSSPVTMVAVAVPFFVLGMLFRHFFGRWQERRKKEQEQSAAPEGFYETELSQQDASCLYETSLVE